MPYKSHADRKRAEAAKPATGIGSRVPHEQMDKAVQYWMKVEQETGQAPSALAVGKWLNLSVAPEWLTSPRFIGLLEVARFQWKLRQLQARPEIVNLVNEIIDLGMIEAQKRLVLTPEEIPNTVLFGDILHKLPKMVQEFTAGTRPVQAGDVFQSVIYEINLIQDPVVREKMRTSILAELERAGMALIQTGETVDADSIAVLRDGSDTVDNPGTELAVPTPDSNIPDDPKLWSDPSLD